MKMITLEIPESVNLDAQEAKNILATQLYENGTLSMGQAADLAGYSKRTFMEMLGKYGVSVFNQSAAKLENRYSKCQELSSLTPVALLSWRK